MPGNTASELIDQFGTDTFKAVHDSDQDGLVYFRKDGTIEYINRAAMTLFGVDDSIVGMNVYQIREEDYAVCGADIIHPSDHFERAREAYRSGIPARSELVVIQDEERRELEVVWGPVHQSGETVGVVGSYRDISPRPDIHDQLSREVARLDEQRRFLASVIDIVDNGIIVFDEAECLQLINPTALELLGLKAPVEGEQLEAIAAQSCFNDPGCFVEYVRRAGANDDAAKAVHFIETDDDSTRRIEITARRGVEHGRIICKLSDTTQRIELQQMELLSQIAGYRTEKTRVDVLSEELVAAIAETLSVDFAVLARHDQGTLRPLAWRGVMLDDDMSVDLKEHAALRDVLETGEVKRVDDWAWQQEPKDERLGHVVIPLVASGEWLGTLHLGYLLRAGAGMFSTTLDALDVAFTNALGNYITAALSNAQLFEKTVTRQEQLEEIIKTLPDGVVLYNRRGDVLLENEAARAITEIDGFENLNTDARPYQIREPNGDTLPRSDWPFFRAVQTGEVCRADVIFDYGNKERDIELIAAPVGEAKPATTFVGLMRDISEQRQIDRRKDDFLSIASHELRSPLTPLTGVLQLARRQLERGEEVDITLLTRAERQVSRLTRLIDGLLDLTRIETGRINLHLQALDFGKFVAKQARPWQLNPKEVKIEVDVPDEPLEVRLDPDRVSQVVTNVVDNAVKYSQPDSVIAIKASDGGDCVNLTIEDDGVGMSEETVERIFDRFFHGRSSDGGPRSMGLGLYICRQIVEEHDGSIAVESTKGEGTTVRVTLPKGLELDANNA